MGVHLWFDKPVCPFDHVVTPGRLIQWVFNHTAIQGRGVAAAEGGPEPGAGERAVAPDAQLSQYLQVVIVPRRTT